MLVRWGYMEIYLLLVTVVGILNFVHNAESNLYPSEAGCIHLRFFDTDSLPFRGLLLQKNEQSDVWIQAYRSGDNSTTPSADQVSSELASLGNDPVVMVTKSTATYRIPVSWRPEEYMWLFSLLVYTHQDIDYTVEVQLPPQQANPHCVDTIVESFTVLITSKVPGVQWFLDHASSHQDEVDDGDSVFLSNLHCYPEVMIAVQDYKLFYSENGFKTEPQYTYDICTLAQLSTSDCSDLIIQDITLTHSNLLILTQSGLFVSATSTESSEALVRIDDLPFPTQGAHFETDDIFCNHGGSLDYDKVRVVGYSIEEPTVVRVWESTPPYTNWETWSSTLCSMPSLTCENIKMVYDSQRMTYIAAVEAESAMVYLIQEGGGFNFFQLPGNFSSTGLLYHPTTSTVYLVGNEIWMSVDRGSTFTLIHSFMIGEFVVDYDRSEQRVAFLTNTGRLYHSRPQAYQIIETQEIDLIVQNVSQLVFDSLGELNAISVLVENRTILSTTIPLVSNDRENIRVCLFSSEIINSHLLLLYTNDSDNTCLLSKGNIGLTVNSSSFGSGVVLTVENDRTIVSMLDSMDASGDDLRMPSEWSFYDEQCWFKLFGTSAGFNQKHEMDVGDHILLQVELELVSKIPIPTNLIPAALREVSVLFGNPNLFDFTVTHQHRLRGHSVVVDVWQKNTTVIPMQSTVTFQLVHCSTHCKLCTLTTAISTICPTGKRLVFIYPTQQDTTQLHRLPINYRPPSWLGTDIPLSPNVYNSDPSQPLMNSKYDISKRAARFNQCAGNSSRAGCNCSSVMATSDDIEFSDCIQLVYEHVYGSSFSLDFQLESSTNGNRAVIQSRIHLHELNNRTDYSIEGQSDITTINTVDFRKLIFKGPGLYHFRATIVDNLSFCNLQAQFTVFVVRTPLPRVGEYATTVLTTVLIGLAILVAYLINNHIPGLQRH